MKTQLIAGIALLSIVTHARAENDAEAIDRLGKAADALTAREGYTTDTDWKMTGDKMQEAVKGRVETLVRTKDRFIRLEGTFQDGQSAVVYQRGAVIAAQDQDKVWGPVNDDPKAKFILRMFNLQTFIQDARGMAVNAKFVHSGLENCMRVEFDADPIRLAKMLKEAEAGKALTSGTLEKATMHISLEIERGTNTIKGLEIVIDGTSTHEPVAEVVRKPGDGFKEWDGEDDDEQKDPKAQPKPEEPKKVEPQGPITETIKVTITTKTPNYNVPADVPIPEEAKKVLGM